MSIPKIPTLLLKNSKNEIYQSKNNIKQYLLKMDNYKNIQEAKRILGVNTANEAYELLLDDWNNFVDIENKRLQAKYNKQLKKYNEESVKKINEKVKQQVEQKKKVEKKKIEDKKKAIKENRRKINEDIKNYRKNKIYNFQSLEQYISSIFETKANRPFTLTLKSISTGITNTWKFYAMTHFSNWLSKIQNETTDSAGNLPSVDLDDIWNDGFKIVSVDDVSGGCNKHCGKSKKLKSAFYKFDLYNPTSKDNNCFFACLKYFGLITETYHNLRKKFNIESGLEIDIETAQTIISKLDLNVMIITYDINEELDDEMKYIILEKNHYFAVNKFEDNGTKNKKTKRGLLTFDFETRETEEFTIVKSTGQKQYILKDTLCCGFYTDYKNLEEKNLKFITSSEKSSARQFIDWLNAKTTSNKRYNIIAHNGGKFDFYFFINQLTTKELLECDISFRGTTIININYRGHTFKDSCCFLTDSLSNLSKSFKVEKGKITSFTLHNKTITSSQLCFYKPELTFNQFLELQHTDKEFWKHYENYCLYDCIALYEIWGKFRECINNLIEKINPYLLSICPLMGSSTIGSHSKKIIVEINKSNNKVDKEKRGIETFTGITYKEERNHKPMSEAQEYSVKKGQLARTLFYKWVKDIDMNKYNFLCNFKRGGISHCHKAGKHMTGITGVDIASQYPASLIHSYIPTGKSNWIYHYDDEKYGFYHLKNLKFNSYLLKPVALSIKDQSLNWATNEMDELFVDSYMLKYLLENYGLEKFEVVKGLVSDWDIKSDKIFGKYINTFYDEKKLQDLYKETNNELYNEALRTTIKLYLNSLTGKLVENPSIHFKTCFNEESKLLINGVGIEKQFNTEKFNDWLVAGIMVYSYSKRLLFEYIKCLPNNSDSVVHIETDGIYFSTKDLPQFTENLKNYEGDYPCCFGSDLGNLKIEKSTPQGQIAYFLGKKFYCITMNDTYNTKLRDDKDKNIYRVKGIPQKTITNNGEDKYLVDVKLYEDVYNWKTEMTPITRTFKTLKKNLFKFETNITSFEMTRTIRAQKGLNLYE